MSIASLQARISRLQAENQRYEKYIQRLQSAKAKTEALETDISGIYARVTRLLDNPHDWKGRTRGEYENPKGEDLRDGYKLYRKGVDGNGDEMQDEIRRLRGEIASNKADIAYCQARIRAIRAAQARAAREAAAGK